MSQDRRIHSLLRYDIVYQNVDLSETDFSVIRGRAGHEIVVVNWFLVASAPVMATWSSALIPSDPTEVTLLAGALNDGALSASPGEAVFVGHFRCLPNEDLGLNLFVVLNVIGYVVAAYVPVGS